MIRWQMLLPTLLLGLVATYTIAPALSQNEELPAPDQTVQEAPTEEQAPVAEVAPAPPRKIIYLYSLDFPPDLVSGNPSPALNETRFWKMMDREMNQTPSLALTENLEEADFRVELRCAGVVNCQSLVVDIKNPQRDVLTSFKMRGIRPTFFGSPKLDLVAHNLTTKIDQRIRAMDQGDYGYSK